MCPTCQDAKIVCRGCGAPVTRPVIVRFCVCNEPPDPMPCPDCVPVPEVRT